MPQSSRRILRARSATPSPDLATSQEGLDLSSAIRAYAVNLEVLRSNDLLIIICSSSAALLFFLRKRMNLYQVKSPTNLLPPRDVSWKGPARSMNNLPVHLSARSSVAFGTTSPHPGLGTVYAQAPGPTESNPSPVGCLAYGLFARVSKESVDVHDIPRATCSRRHKGDI